MSSFPVFADALSRLHADIAITRLVRAGIARDRISAIFPRRRAPNSVCCWLSNFHEIPSASSSWPMAAAGLLGQLFRRGLAVRQQEKKLERLGLDCDLMRRLREKIRSGQIVVCVHAQTETEATVASHIFLHVGAENLTCATPDLIVAQRELRDHAPQWAGLAA